MSQLVRWVRSSIGSKMLMGLTGILLVVFLFAHMAGNLQVFLGPAAINGYAKSLRMMGPLLWMARIGLIALVLIHIATAIKLTLANRAARPVRYAKTTRVVTGWGARTMALTGLIIFAFVVYHLLHYTLYVTNPKFAHLHDAYGRHDVYSMVVQGFGNFAISISYVVANALLCLHLAHGIPSFFQSLGLSGPRFTPAIEKIGPITAALLFLGFVIVPIGVMAGWVKPIAGVVS